MTLLTCGQFSSLLLLLLSQCFGLCALWPSSGLCATRETGIYDIHDEDLRAYRPNCDKDRNEENSPYAKECK